MRWNYTLRLKNKEYTGTCKIPTATQIAKQCSQYYRGYLKFPNDYYMINEWNILSGASSTTGWVRKTGAIGANAEGSMGFLPYIEVEL